MMVNNQYNVFDQLLTNDHTLKLTDLRKAVLAIFLDSKKAMSAYDVLAILKQNRDSAEPMTVYRVIEYFIERNIIHRISTENKYVFCRHIENNACKHQGLFFICKKCLSSFEVIDQAFDHLLKALAKQKHFLADASAFVEVKGLCQACQLLDKRIEQ
ncbi:MAG: transcriptional repressor [Pseudomonadota bacterium]